MNDDRAGDQKVAAVAASMITAVIPRESGEKGTVGKVYEIVYSNS